ncbi:MAG: hypothetical protein ACPGN3_17655 [Opitutales bacterium]
MKIRVLVWISLALACKIYGIGYSEPNSYKNPNKTVSISASSADDTQTLKDAIAEVEAAGGGKVWCPAGTYVMSGIAVPSNVHITFHKDAVIYSRNDGNSIFSFGKKGSGTVRNASIRGQGGYPDVIVETSDSFRFVIGRDMDNCMVSGFRIEDPQESVYSSIELSWDSDSDATPHNITIKNIDQIGGAYGYGITQIQAASDTLFTNLKGTGGVTLRLETGLKSMNIANRGGVYNIKGTNLVSTLGQSTVKMQPHTRQNGDVYLNFVTANETLFAVKSEDGGNWKYTDQQIADNPWLVKGSFDKISMGNCHGIYSAGGIDVKYGSLDLYSLEELETKVFRSATNETGYTGPSISVIGDFGDRDSVSIWKTTAEGAFVNNKIMRDGDGYDHPGWVKRGRPYN